MILYTILLYNTVPLLRHYIEIYYIQLYTSYYSIYIYFFFYGFTILLLFYTYIIYIGIYSGFRMHTDKRPRRQRLDRLR